LETAFRTLISQENFFQERFANKSFLNPQDGQISFFLKLEKILLKKSSDPFYMKNHIFLPK